ncbi:hypothetical protein V6E02_12165 [Thiobacter sp. AK1]|uniref:Uncharacterized protein n=2 Tax=Thiobacter aerophilum TaxID=3121275 RepID=A0ABV0EH29_9BURK
MFFEQKIDLRSKRAMVNFLDGHYRYYTMNSWNRTTSYANRVKIPYLGLTREQASRAYDMLDTDYWDELQPIIDDFTSEMKGQYTIATNGRSGGYLVLYSKVASGIDDGLSRDEFMDWSMSDLRDRVELVCRFDRASDEIRDAFINLLDNCKVVEETVMVPKTVKRIVCSTA